MYSSKYCSDISVVFQHILLPLDVAFTIFFIIEMIVKIRCLGKSFFKDKECVFDLLIVVNPIIWVIQFRLDSSNAIDSNI